MARGFDSTEAAVDFIFLNVGKQLRLGAPLGLGKPNFILNAIYERAKKDPSCQLTIFTALSLCPPESRDPLSKRFLEPFVKRQWGENYPVLAYARDAIKGKLPSHVRVHEFYMAAGSSLNSLGMQCDYQSLNYTHVSARLADEKINVVVQLVAKSPEGKISLSCNPDLTLDVVDRCREKGIKPLMVAVVHPDLPFTAGEAEVGHDFFDIVVEDKSRTHKLFGLPRPTVDETDHAIGFFASQMVVDDGTIQIGIGSLSDAVVASLVMREKKNALYQELVKTAWQGQTPSESLKLNTAPFTHGLYGLSEMVMDGFMHLRRAGILRREVKDVTSGKPTFLHGAFFLGSNEFYEWLRSLKGDEREGVRMGRISHVNQLYSAHMQTFIEQRKNPRFFNTCMQVTLLGGAASETLENGKVVSGVGGQYNFVAMSHELKNSRSVLMLRAARESKGVRTSNIVASHGHLTIPRHLRDVVVTEYGIADLKGRTDEECIKALLNIADSQFQESLLASAKQAGKISPSYQIPEGARNNTPEKVAAWIGAGKKQGVFPVFPFGSDFTPEEERLVRALEAMKSAAAGPGSKKRLAGQFFDSFKVDQTRFSSELDRMGMKNAEDFKTKFVRRLLLYNLEAQ